MQVEEHISTVEIPLDTTAERIQREKANPEQRPGDNQFSDILGEAFWLIGRSKDLRGRSVGDMHDIVVGAVRARSFRLYRQNGAPMAFVAWALLDEVQEVRLRAGAILTAEELRSGDRAWVILAASPFVPVEAVLKDLRTSDFPDRPLMNII